MEEKVIMRELHAKKDEKILFDIVEHENKVFGDASIGNWNVKPFAKYGKIYATLIQDENQNEKIVSVWSFYCSRVSREKICYKIVKICVGEFGKIGN